MFGNLLKVAGLLLKKTGNVLLIEPSTTQDSMITYHAKLKKSYQQTLKEYREELSKLDQALQVEKV